MAAEARMLFVLTTNRPEVLEPALAARPGRIDQAIADMLGAGGRFAACMLGAQTAIGFADVA